MRRLITGLALTGALIIGSVAPTFAGQPTKTTIWLDGQQVRTIVPPAAAPQAGKDAFYRVPGTGGVAAVGPGDQGYHGGYWAVHDVSFVGGDPFPLTSQEAILAAEDAGLVTIVRVAADDFKCPIRGR
jgi:hypothetical protein